MARILVAEDEKPLARALELKLTHSGYGVDIAYNGKEALTLLEQKKFDMLLLDLVMPEVDGFSVLSEMKKKHISIPVIVLTNLGQENDVERAKSLGAKDYFVKSQISIAAIIERIQLMLARHEH